MKKHFLWAVIAIAISLSIVYGVSTIDGSAEKNSAEKTTVGTAPDESEKEKRVLQQKERSFLNQLKKVKLDERYLAGENEPEEDGMDVITEEEMREHAARWRRVTPIYNSQAPVVLAEIMMEEKVNEKWTEEVKTESLEVTEKAEFKGTHFADVECHESLCRLRLLHDDNPSFEHFRDTGMDTGPWNTDLFGKRNDLEDGRVESTMFFSDREGNPEPFNVMMDRLDEIATLLLQEEE